MPRPHPPSLDALRALVDARPGPGRWAALMYHELEVPGRALASGAPGYAVYCVARDAFRAQLDALAGAGLRGRSLGEAHARGDAATVAITFDDGCETDLTEAAPALRERGFGATFFVIAGLLGRPGYLSPAQLRELAAAGFEIGSHSLTHRMLTALDPGELDRELTGSRSRIEDAAGAPVAHFSCPHGRWSPAVAAAARRAGYATVSTSEVGLNGPATPGTRLRRIAVQRGAGAESVARLARGHGLWRRIARGAVLDAGKRVLGEGAYAAVRGGLFRRSR
jgi:peptidoglycan/xylan/chitin deacetylase (PgdA/CDA1 family)